MDRGMVHTNNRTCTAEAAERSTRAISAPEVRGIYIDESMGELVTHAPSSGARIGLSGLCRVEHTPSNDHLSRFTLSFFELSGLSRTYSRPLIFILCAPMGAAFDLRPALRRGTFFRFPMSYARCDRGTVILTFDFVIRFTSQIPMNGADQRSIPCRTRISQVGATWT